MFMRINSGRIKLIFCLRLVQKQSSITLVFWLHVSNFQFVSKKTCVVMPIGYYIALKAGEIADQVTALPVFTLPLVINPVRIISSLLFAVFQGKVLFCRIVPRLTGVHAYLSYVKNRYKRQIKYSICTKVFLFKCYLMT